MSGEPDSSVSKCNGNTALVVEMLSISAVEFIESRGVEKQAEKRFGISLLFLQAHEKFEGRLRARKLCVPKDFLRKHAVYASISFVHKEVIQCRDEKFILRRSDETTCTIEESRPLDIPLDVLSRTQEHIVYERAGLHFIEKQ